jgi:3-(3-hydroxy-phenyl)propionate hydroxylase
MVNLSRRLGAVIMPTNRMLAGLRDTVFALLNLSNGFRGFVRRCGVLPPPQISKSALTGVGRDAVIGQMLPQPDVAAGGDVRPLDSWLGCHQWLVLGVGSDPVAVLSNRDRAILHGLGAYFIAVNAAADGPTLSLKCCDQSFLDWSKGHRLGGVLVRPDRFIAERLTPHAELRSLDAFVNAAQAPAIASAKTAA